MYRYGKKRSTTFRKLSIFLSLVIIATGLYVLLLTKSPSLSFVAATNGNTSISLDTTDDDQDIRDRIQIEKIGLEVPFFTGDTSQTLEKGAWWRFPERGSPTNGGNFILSAHRFNLGLTPQGTKARSPFYNLDKLTTDDSIRIFHKGTWYDYKVTNTYSVAPSAVEIEAPSAEPKLTLYSCTLKGSADGRIVVEAHLR